MPLQYDIQVKKSYINVIVSGTYSFNKLHPIINSTLLECIKNDMSNILMDLRTTKGNMSTFERFNNAVYFAELSKGHQKTLAVKLAVVGFPPLIDPNRFGETVAINKGVYIKVTNDIEEALSWLQIDEDSL